MHSKRDIEAVKKQLDSVREGHMAKWRDLADYFCPTAQRFQITDANKGDRRNQKILDPTGLLAVRTLRSGMMSGITSPARPWFRLSTTDSDLDQFAPVAAYLHDSAQILRDLFIKSNLYSKLPQVYASLGVFGTAAMGCVEDAEDVLRFYAFPTGSYWLATDERERIDTFIRETTMTVRQLAARFGKDALSDSCKHKLANGQGEQWIEVVQAVMPNPGHYRGAMAAADLPFVSCWYEKAGPEDKMLGVSGFHEFPIFAPRWDTVGEDVWGDGPALDVLGDVKQLQAYERKSLKGVDKTIDPPLMGPSTLQQKRVSLLPGDITYVDEAQTMAGLRPIHETSFRLDMVEAKQQQNRQRISRGLYEDLFLMLANSDRRQITAREIEERHEEKLLALGPVLERLNDELLDPLIDRAFNIAERRGMLPPPPEEIQGRPLKVEYISIMAAAQRMVAMGSTERFFGFVARAAQIQPEALDKVNVDASINEVADQLGVNPKMLRDDKQAAAIRQGRAQAAQAQMQQQAMLDQAKAAQSLANTPIQSPSALSAIADIATAGAA